MIRNKKIWVRERVGRKTNIGKERKRGTCESQISETHNRAVEKNREGDRTRNKEPLD